MLVENIIGEKKKQIMTCDWLGWCFRRLVMADVAYYTGQLKSLGGVSELREAMEDIWDRSWRYFSLVKEIDFLTVM